MLIAKAFITQLDGRVNFCAGNPCLNLHYIWRKCYFSIKNWKHSTLKCSKSRKNFLWIEFQPPSFLLSKRNKVSKKNKKSCIVFLEGLNFWLVIRQQSTFGFINFGFLIYHDLHAECLLNMQFTRNSCFLSTHIVITTFSMNLYLRLPLKISKYIIY